MAPLETLTGPVIFTPAAPMSRVPWEIVVVPLNAMEPFNVSVPVPDLTKPPLPKRVASIVLELPSPPSVNVPNPVCTTPEPEMDARLRLLSLRFSVAPAATATTVLGGRQVPLIPRRNSPAFTVVAPA